MIVQLFFVSYHMVSVKYSHSYHIVDSFDLFLDMYTFLQKPEYLHGLSRTADCESSVTGSPLQAPQQKISSDMRHSERNSVGRKSDDISLLNYIPEKTQAGDLFSATARGWQPPSVSQPLDYLLCKLKFK